MTLSDSLGFHRRNKFVVPNWSIRARPHNPSAEGHRLSAEIRVMFYGFWCRLWFFWVYSTLGCWISRRFFQLLTISWSFVETKAGCQICIDAGYLFGSGMSLQKGVQTNHYFFFYKTFASS
jgi:hypothetical protein